MQQTHGRARRRRRLPSAAARMASLTRKRRRRDACTQLAPDSTTFDLDADRLREECGVFGIFGHPDAAAITALGLHALQHRGQEAAASSPSTASASTPSAASASSATLSPRATSSSACPGTAAIGHVRYSTTGETILRNVQPLFAELDGGGFAVAHNGNLTNGLTLRRQLIREGAICQSTSDTEVVLHLVAALAARPLRRPLHRRAAPDRRRLRVRRPDQQEADRRPRPARHPPAGARRARRPSDPLPRRPARSTSSAPRSSATSRTARSS